MQPMQPKPSKPSCPICSRAATPAHAPFCTQGCRDRDLLQWLGEGYRVPGPKADEDSLDSGVDSDD
jgi:uncharacterized protein